QRGAEGGVSCVVLRRIEGRHDDLESCATNRDEAFVSRSSSDLIATLLSAVRMRTYQGACSVVWLYATRCATRLFWIVVMDHTSDRLLLLHKKKLASQHLLH
ncbi:unnamed protein product, partial [Scytosiphon promiscuus]